MYDHKFEMFVSRQLVGDTIGQRKKIRDRKKNLGTYKGSVYFLLIDYSDHTPGRDRIDKM